MSRTMVGLPSQLGLQIVDDVCEKGKKLETCCCRRAALSIWTDKLPVHIRSHISNMPFDHTTYKTVFEAADKVHLASRQVQVSAVSTMDETLPAFTPENQPGQVAAVTRGGGGRGRSGTRGGGRGRGRGGNRGARGGGQGNKPRGPKHSSNPPDSCCNRHYVHGDQAWYCVAPLTCPWVGKVTAPAQK